MCSRDDDPSQHDVPRQTREEQELQYHAQNHHLGHTSDFCGECQVLIRKATASRKAKPLTPEELASYRAWGEAWDGWGWPNVQRLIATIDHDRAVYEQARDAYQQTILELGESPARRQNLGFTMQQVAGCAAAGNADARSIGLDWCLTHDSRWVLDNPVCDKAKEEVP